MSATQALLSSDNVSHTAAVLGATAERLNTTLQRIITVPPLGPNHDYQNLMNAITDAENATGDATIKLSGAYQVDQLMTATGNPASEKTIVIQGDGNSPTGTSISLVDGANCKMFRFVDCVRGALRNVYLYGNKANQTGSSRHAVEVVNSAWFELNAVVARKFKGRGLRLINKDASVLADEVKVLGVTLHENDEGNLQFAMEGSSGASAGDASVIGGHFDFSAGNGIEGAYSSFNTFSGVQTLSNDGFGVLMIGGMGSNFAGHTSRASGKANVRFGSAAEGHARAIYQGISHLGSRTGSGLYSGVELIDSVKCRIDAQSHDFFYGFSPTYQAYGLSINANSDYCQVSGNYEAANNVTGAINDLAAHTQYGAKNSV